MDQQWVGWLLGKSGSAVKDIEAKWHELPAKVEPQLTAGQHWSKDLRKPGAEFKQSSSC